MFETGLPLALRGRAGERAEEGGVEAGGGQGDLLTFSELRFSLEKKGPIAYGDAVKLHHRRRIITICAAAAASAAAAACGRQLITCQHTHIYKK